MEKQQLDNYKQLGLNIAYYRKSKGLSQIQLAEKVNISRTHMSRIETADCAVSLDVVFNICDILEIKPNKLLRMLYLINYLVNYQKMFILLNFLLIYHL